MEFYPHFGNALYKLNIVCFIGSTCVNHVFYADDICLMAASAMGLQQLINACDKYGIEHDILYNPIKSKCMAVVPSRYTRNLSIVTLDNINLVYENSVTYLGVVLDSKLKDDIDIARQIHVRSFMPASIN